MTLGRIVGGSKGRAFGVLLLAIIVLGGLGGGPTSLLPVRSATAASATTIEGKIVILTTTYNATRNDSDFVISTVNPDGSGLQELTRGENLATEIDVSPDGSKMAFGTDKVGQSGEYVMNLDGSGLHKITSNTTGMVWSPDGTKLAYTINIPNGTTRQSDDISDIYVANVDGSGVKKITSSDGLIQTFRWSPDTKKIAFSRLHEISYGTDQSNIFVINPDGTGKVNLTNHTGDNQFAFAPAWSPDGKKIAFSDTIGFGRPTSSDIYVMDATDGTGRVNFSAGIEHDSVDAPVWSPDGSKILFSIGHSNPYSTAMYVVDAADASNKVSLGHSTIALPLWSPDSKKIAFDSNEAGSRNAYVIEPDGSGFTRLSNSTADYIFNGVWKWSPDSTKLILSSNKDLPSSSSTNELYEVNADGTDQLRLTFNDASDSLLYWAGSQTPAKEPEKPSVSNGEGYLYVVSSGTNEVLRYNETTGDLHDRFVTTASHGLKFPNDFVFGPDGNLYVSSFTTNDIKRYNGTTGAFVDVFESGAAGQLGFGLDGNLYLAGGSELFRYNVTTGQLLGTFVDGSKQNLSQISDFFFRANDGYLYLLSPSGVLRYNGSTGEFHDVFVNTPEDVDAYGVNKPSMTFGPDGNLYVAWTSFQPYFSTNQVLRYNGTTGAFMDVFVSDHSGGLSGPGERVVFGPDRNLYVSSSGTGQILRYNGTSGQFKDAFVIGASRPFVFGPDGNLYTSSPKDIIGRYNGTTGAYLSPFITDGTNPLRDPYALAFGPDGNLYVSASYHILKYNGTTGQFKQALSHNGTSGPSYPWNLSFGPDGNLYVVGQGEVLRYNGTSGAFIDTFVSVQATEGLLGGLAFGPDRNLYVTTSSVVAPEFDRILRYNGTTGQFKDVFVQANSGGLKNPQNLTFGPDKNLYVIAAGAVLRYNGTTGAFMDKFVNFNNTLYGDRLVFGPDGNLYVGNRHSILRYDGKSGQFMDEFLNATSGGTSSLGGLAFSPAFTQETKPQTPTTSRQSANLIVNSIDLSGKPVQGVWTVIRNAANGNVVKTGYTPLEFTGQSGQQYEVSSANYDGKTFKHWENDNNVPSRMVTLASDMTLTATYDTGDSLRGFAPLTYKGANGQPDLTVIAKSMNDNNSILPMYAIIDPQSTNASGSTTYKVYAGNYGNLTFDHWSDGDRDSIRMLTIREATTIAAYYKTGH